MPKILLFRVNVVWSTLLHITTSLRVEQWNKNMNKTSNLVSSLHKTWVICLMVLIQMYRRYVIRFYMYIISYVIWAKTIFKKVTFCYFISNLWSSLKALTHTQTSKLERCSLRSNITLLWQLKKVYCRWNAVICIIPTYPCLKFLKSC